MAKYYYVKSGFGTRVTDTSFTAAETGAFGSGNLTAANCFSSWAYICDNFTPTDGDFVLISDVSSSSYGSAGGAVLVNNTGANNGAGLTVISVDDTDVTKYKPGASEHINSSLWDFAFGNNGGVFGVDISSGDDCIVTNGNYRCWTFNDLKLTVDGNLDMAVRGSVDGHSKLIFNNVDIATNATNISAGIFITQYGAHFEWNGGTLLANGFGLTSKLFSSVGTGRGSKIIFRNVDLDNTADNELTLVSTFNDNQDSVWMEFYNCKFPTNVTFPTQGTDLVYENHEFLSHHSDDGTSNDFLRYKYANGLGAVETNKSVYVTGMPNINEETSGNKFSLQVKTTSSINRARPFKFKIPKQYVDIGNTSTDKIIIHLVTDASLLDTDIDARLLYRDSLGGIAANWKSATAYVTNSMVTNPWEAGSAITNDSTYGKAIGDWTGATGLTPYTLVIDTSGDAGEAGIVEVEIFLYKDFTTSADVLYIHPILEIGT